jgi:hypothetical protein
MTKTGRAAVLTLVLVLAGATVIWGGEQRSNAAPAGQANAVNDSSPSSAPPAMTSTPVRGGEAYAGYIPPPPPPADAAAVGAPAPVFDQERFEREAYPLPTGHAQIVGSVVDESTGNPINTAVFTILPWVAGPAPVPEFSMTGPGRFTSGDFTLPGEEEVAFRIDITAPGHGTLIVERVPLYNRQIVYLTLELPPPGVVKTKPGIRDRANRVPPPMYDQRISRAPTASAKGEPAP